MAQTATDIANLALATLGAKRITDIDDDTQKSARISKLHYEQAREEVLRSGHWNWAMKRATLTQHTDAPVYGYNYQYPLPGDFVRLSSVNEVSIWNSQVADWFDIESGQDSGGGDIGPVLLTNQDNIRIKYISDVTDTVRFDALFVRALFTLLASKMARAITGSDSREERLRGQYEQLDLPTAQQVDGSETRGGVNPPIIDAMSRSYFVRARGNYGLDATPDGPTSPSAFPTP